MKDIILQDTFIDVLKEILVNLEVDRPIEPTSILHDELKSFMIAQNMTTEDEIKQMVNDDIESRKH